MAVEGFDGAKCQRRNRLAALRGVEAAPVRLGVLSLPEGAVLIDSEGGDMPDSAAGALERINALLPSLSAPLTEEDIYFHPVEAASGRFIGDRFAFLSESTLRNIARHGAQGRAFMNSHRTGGFSTESELPFGKTCTGRFEQWLMPDGRIAERALLGIYLLRGMAPNGANGPTTDDLHRLIAGGVLADVSVGLDPSGFGRLVCDVCGEDYWEGDCPHYAGTTYGMNATEIARQQERGVPHGRASYTLDNWGLSEVSGVYDGAVPGAGFAKAQQLTAGGVPETFAAEIIDSFGHLVGGKL